MNTRIDYLYRDADNEEEYHTVILSGAISLEHIQPLLNDGRIVVFTLLQLPGLRRRLQFQPGADDPNRYDLIGVTLTNDRVSVEVTADELQQALLTNTKQRESFRRLPMEDFT